MIVVPVVDQEHAAFTQTLFKVADGLLLLPLVSVIVLHVGEGVAQTNHRIEAVADQWLDIIVQSQPIGLLNHWKTNGT